MSDDDVIDFMIIEALSLKDMKDENERMKKAEEDRERREWAQDFDSFRERLAE